MLFSSDDVAEYITEHFEPAWESVRPVPTVTIDFGNGQKITRTLHGNVATYVCDPAGTVLDILPGVYTPEEYRRQLEQLVLLSRYVAAPTPEKSEARLKDYHARQAALLAKKEPPATLVEDPRAGMSIFRVENPILLIAGGKANRAAARAVGAGRPGSAAHRNPPKTAAEKIAGWKELAEDTRINETVHRLTIHKKLADSVPVRPGDMTKWLYKEVLHADLDDPLLGLGEVLGKNYPFAEEERKVVP